MSEAKIYVLMVTVSKVVFLTLKPATAQDVIEAACSFEVFPAAVSDDVEALREHARKMREKFSTIDGWNTFEVPVIGGFDDADRR